MLFSFVILSKSNLFVCYKNEFLGWQKTKKLFEKLPFFNTFIKKTKTAGLKNIDLLLELPLYNELNIMQISNLFGWYAKSHKVEIVDSKDPLAE